MSLSSAQKETLREETLRYLAARQMVAMQSDAIAAFLRRHSAVDFRIEVVDVDEALKFLEGMGYVKANHAGLGATVRWEVSSQGVLHAEREGLL